MTSRRSGRPSPTCCTASTDSQRQLLDEERQPPCWCGIALDLPPRDDVAREVATPLWCPIVHRPEEPAANRLDLRPASSFGTCLSGVGGTVHDHSGPCNRRFRTLREKPRMNHVAAWLRGVRGGISRRCHTGTTPARRSAEVGTNRRAARVLPSWIRTRWFASSTSPQASATDSPTLTPVSTSVITARR